MTKIQSLLFDKKYWNIKEALKWQYNNGYKPIKRVHITKEYLRYRQSEPLKNKNYRIINLGNHIKAVIEF